MSEAPASIFNQMHKAGRRDNGKSSPVKIFNKDFKRHSRDQEMKFILTIFAIGKLLPCYMRGKASTLGQKKNGCRPITEIIIFHPFAIPS